MTHKRKKCFARKSRFTIIELIVVMLIMSMMLVVALPAFTHLDKDYKQQQAVQEISGQIAIAKSYSIMVRIKSCLELQLPIICSLLFLNMVYQGPDRWYP